MIAFLGVPNHLLRALANHSIGVCAAIGNELFEFIVRRIHLRVSGHHRTGVVRGIVGRALPRLDRRHVEIRLAGAR